MSVSIIASNITVAASSPNYDAGTQCRMADGNYIHITPEVAAQWLPVLQQIADDSK